MTHKRDRVRKIHVHGLSVRVSERRAQGRLADEPPLLLCNGMDASLETLQPFVDALDSDRGIVRFDVPGIGGSPAPMFPYSMPWLASWVVTLMRELGHDRFDVLGMSWGGALAQQMAVQNYGPVRSVVLVATSAASVIAPAQQSLLAKLFTQQRQRDQTYAEQVAGEVFGGSMRTAPERGTWLLRNGNRMGPKGGYFYQLFATAGWSSMTFLPMVRQPTLVLAGDDDPIIPVSNARVMAQLIPDAEFHVYSGGHLTMLTDSEELAPLVDDFLARAAAAG